MRFSLFYFQLCHEYRHENLRNALHQLSSIFGAVVLNGEIGRKIGKLL